MRPALRRHATPVGLYTITAAALLALQFVSARVLRGDGSLTPWRGWSIYLGSWSQFDGPEYLRIADQGYSYAAGARSSVVWFPLYPLLVRGVGTLTGDLLTAGVVVSLSAGLAAAVLYWRWLTLQGLDGSERLVAYAVLALYPYGWYLYGVVHSDSLFLALTLGAFVLLERDRLVLAGLVGALATATRPTGLALIAPLVVLGLQREGVLRVPAAVGGWRARLAVPTGLDLSRLRAPSLAPALAVVGIGAYGAYLWARFGSPLLFATNQSTYHPAAHPVLKLDFIGRWRNFGDDPSYALTIGGQAVMCGVVLLTIPAVARRFGFAYALFLAVLVAIPTLGTEDFMGTGRYLMAAFPAFALLGLRLTSHTGLRAAALALWGLTMVGLSMAFARSVYLT